MVNNKSTRRDFMRWAGSVAATAFGARLLQAGEQSVMPRPNILFIMVDEMRWDAMGCEDNKIVRTPNLDRLAREGTRFATAYTCSPVCVPSRYCFFTSRYAHVHGSTDNSTPPQAGQVLLPALLKHHGYQTAISGKLHFLPPEQDFSFDSFWSFSNEGPGKLQNWPQYMDARHGKNSARRLVPGSQPFPDDPLGKDLGRLPYPKEDSQTFWITDRAIDYLRERDRQKPFFLFVSYLDPHSPSHLCEPYWSMYDAEKMPNPRIPDAVKKQRPEAVRNDARGGGRHLIDSEAMARALTAAYYAKVTMVDDNVGRLLQQVESTGLSDDTIIVFTADHGNMLGDHGRWFKGVMYEGSSRIPLMIKAPRRSAFAAVFNRGKVINEMVENIDLMPTLMEMIGRPLPSDSGLQGASMVNLAAGKQTSWKTAIFAERGSMMIRTARYKLIKNQEKDMREGAGAYELYDLVNDPGEDMNLIDDPACAALVAELKARLQAWQKDCPPLPTIKGVLTTQGGPPAEGQVKTGRRQPRLRPNKKE
ncbi:MAG TPA: sulfatase-like hydrolase/transferase [Sedimentisphaerales bacterium]|nr:sulfatase-like hydrolase/transferase [Sedimentisphaerales bacterium]